MILHEAVLRFLEYCELDKNLSQSTIKMYSYYILFFETWFTQVYKKKSLIVEDITDEDIRKFRLYLAQVYKKPDHGELKKQTQNYFLVCLRSFFRFLIKKGYKTISPEQIDLGKMADRQIRTIDQDDLTRLLSSPDTKKIMGLRDKAILECLFSTGLRVSELVGLNKENINLDTCEFSVIGKGGKARVVFITKVAAEWIKKYLEARDDTSHALFVSYSGPRSKDIPGGRNRLTARSVERMIAKYKKQAGIVKFVSPHVLRHSFATDLLNNGANLRSVQELLGHKNISTTQVYTHLTDPQLKETHQKYHSGNK